MKSSKLIYRESRKKNNHCPQYFTNIHTSNTDRGVTISYSWAARFLWRYNCANTTAVPVTF